MQGSFCKIFRFYIGKIAAGYIQGREVAGWIRPTAAAPGPSRRGFALFGRFEKKDLRKDWSVLVCGYGIIINWIF